MAGRKGRGERKMGREDEGERISEGRGNVGTRKPKRRGIKRNEIGTGKDMGMLHEKQKGRKGE